MVISAEKPNATPAHHSPQLTKLLMPTDFSPESTAGIEWGAFLAQYGAQEISLCHVIESPFMEMYKSDETEFDKQVALGKLAALRRSFDGLTAKVELLTRDGLPAENLLTVAAEKNIDLLVIATHGRTGIHHVVLGSVAEKVIRSVCCPVLVVRS